MFFFHPRHRRDVAEGHEIFFLIYLRLKPGPTMRIRIKVIRIWIREQHFANSDLGRQTGADCVTVYL